MRLDMFICSSTLFQNNLSRNFHSENKDIDINNKPHIQVFDSYILHEFNQEYPVSDHCPIALILEL